MTGLPTAGGTSVTASFSTVVEIYGPARVNRTRALGVEGLTTLMAMTVNI
jgi:hypothetical protein